MNASMRLVRSARSQSFGKFCVDGWWVFVISKMLSCTLVIPSPPKVLFWRWGASLFVLAWPAPAIRSKERAEGVHSFHCLPNPSIATTIGPNILCL